MGGKKGGNQETRKLKECYPCGTWLTAVMVTKTLLHTRTHTSIPLCHFKELACRACPSAPSEEVCCAVCSGRSAARYHCGRAEWRGSFLGLNLVPVQNPWARAAASQGATVRRQDIPAQDEEMSVTTCYAKPPSWRRKKKGGGGGGNGRERQFRHGLGVCVCTGRRDYACAFLCMSVCVCCDCVFVVCFSREMSCGLTAGWDLPLSRSTGLAFNVWVYEMSNSSSKWRITTLR